jgi:hypothetical protein
MDLNKSTKGESLGEDELRIVYESIFNVDKREDRA